MNFNEFDLVAPIQKALRDIGYSVATEIQNKAIPHILRGEDLLGCAQTGTGKTAAFALPILQLLQAHQPSGGISALVLTPTRELALQIEANFNAYAQYLPAKTIAVFGGVVQTKQVNAIKKGIDVLVATPGRLLDLMQQGIISLSQLKVLVLDEADHMLDMGFINDVKKILAKVPTNRQTLLFSATMPQSIKKLARAILKNPVEVSVTPAATAAQTVQQSLYYVEKKEKAALLIQLLKEYPAERTLVFTRTKHGADRLVKQLNKAGLLSAAIHGDKSQNARQRALEDFKNSRIKILVATDIAARGIDIDELPHVVNYELPDVPETYVHRIGRTGRAGNAGIAVSFCSSDEKDALKGIQKLIGFQMPVKKLDSVQ